MSPSVGSNPSDVWYAQGLRFSCTQCGRCCGGAPGYVWVDRADIERMAAHLDMPVDRFRSDYCRRVWLRVSLKERPNGDCVLLGPGGCTVYPVRPPQCRTFPFWTHILKNRRSWEALKKKCPGVGQGRLYTARQIEQISRGERCT